MSLRFDTFPDFNKCAQMRLCVIEAAQAASYLMYYVFLNHMFSFRLEAKDAAAQAIVGLNGTDVGGFNVRCSWGKESNDGSRPQGGAGGYGGYNQQQQQYYPQVIINTPCINILFLSIGDSDVYVMVRLRPILL